MEFIIFVYLKFFFFFKVISCNLFLIVIYKKKIIHTNSLI